MKMGDDSRPLGKCTKENVFMSLIEKKFDGCIEVMPGNELNRIDIGLTVSLVEVKMILENKSVGEIEN